MIASIEQYLFIDEGHPYWAFPRLALQLWAATLLTGALYFSVVLLIATPVLLAITTNVVPAMQAVTVAAFFLRLLPDPALGRIVNTVVASYFLSTILILAFVIAATVHFALLAYRRRAPEETSRPAPTLRQMIPSLIVSLVGLACVSGALILSSEFGTTFMFRLLLALLALITGAGIYHFVINAPTLMVRLLHRSLVALPLIVIGAAAVKWSEQYPTSRDALTWTPSLFIGGLLLLIALASLVPQGRLITILGAPLFIFSLLLPGIWKLTVRPADSSASNEQILLVVIDTLRQDAVGAFNSQSTNTPAIDALASQSDIYPYAYSTSPWTLPSIVSLMTGLMPAVHHVNTFDSQMPDNLHTVAEVTRDHGMLTAAATMNPLLNIERGIARGFDTYLHFPLEAINERPALRLLQMANPDFFTKMDSTKALVSTALEWLVLHRHEPFFFWLHIFDPHIPYEPPPEYLASEKIPEHITLPDSRTRGISTELTDEEKEWWKQLYLAEVRYVDDCLGDLFDSLKAVRIFDSMTISVTSDHGEEFWEHGGFEHGHSVHEEVVRVPLILKVPRGESQSTIQSLVGIQNTASLLLDSAGIPNPSEFEGTGPDAEQNASSVKHPLPESLYISHCIYGPDRWALVFLPFKAHGLVEKTNLLLYNLETDPKELRPVPFIPAPQRIMVRSQLATTKAEAEQKRKTLALEEKQQIELDEETIRELKSLGYM